MPTAYDSDLAKKLNLKSGMKVRVVGQPDDVDLSGLTVTAEEGADGVLAFAATMAEVGQRQQPVVEAAKAGRISWMAYPKGGQLGTDLNRDILWRHMQGQGVEAVRQVALDETWSVMRFKGAKG